MILGKLAGNIKVEEKQKSDHMTHEERGGAYLTALTGDHAVVDPR